MVIDYKGVSFSFRKKHIEKRVKRIRLIVLGLIVIAVYLLAAAIIDANKLKSIQALLLEGKTEEAAARLESAGSSIFHGKSRKELRALVHLFFDEFDEAKNVLEAMDGKTSSMDSQKFLGYFSDRARYRSLDIYSGYLTREIEDDERGQQLLVYRAMAKTGRLDYQQSAEALEKLSPQARQSHEKVLSLIEAVNEQLRAGKINYIFDINGKPLAYYDIAGAKTVSLAPGIEFGAFNREFEKNTMFYGLSLNRDIQVLLDRLFKPFNGSFLLLNLADGSIAAAYSKPFDLAKANDNTVFSQAFEPGSVIKLLTMFAYLNSAPGELFPFQCKGLLSLDGKTFRDWVTHGRVESCEEALAVSCNAAFARMGLEVGFGRLSGVFDRFYFNSADFTDLFLCFKTGSYNKGLSQKYRLANLAVGLEELSVTTFHAALIGALISQGGSIYGPYLIKSKKNLLDIGFYNHTLNLLPELPGGTAFVKIKNAMTAVVEHPSGTGRRAKTDAVKAALKTGTAGSKAKGLDAVLAGFFPADKPAYAFAFRLERAGKAEWKGAFFLKDFLTAFSALR